MTTYDLTQTTFLFSWAANGADNVTATSSQDFAEFLKLSVGNGGPWTWTANNNKSVTVKGLIASIGDQMIGAPWRIVWGPGVLVEPGATTQTNSMVVVYSSTLDTYIVAIAGTDPSSFYDWWREDFQVGGNEMVDFPLPTPLTPGTPPKGIAANKDNPQISLGTATGLYNLLTQLTDAEGDNLDIASYLSGLTPAQSTSSTLHKIIFTGHSLGGALSPTLAYQLLPGLTNWTANGVGQVCVLPTAGPSPGNAQFASGWNTKFPATPVSTNGANQIVNLNVPYFDLQDMVPHAWQYIYSDAASYQDGVYPNPSCPYYVYNYAITDGAETQLAGLGILLDVVVGLAGLNQGKGTAGFMRSLPGATGLTGTFPIAYYDKGASTWTTLPPSPKQPKPPAPPVPPPPPPTTINDLDTFMTYIGVIHVWHYFQFFDIDPTLIPRPLS